MDLYVRLPARVADAVKQVQDLLVIELQGEHMHCDPKVTKRSTFIWSERSLDSVRDQTVS